jgi:hypothetical protein
MYAGESPHIAHVSCLTRAGQRVWVNSNDMNLMQSMTCEEFCGRDARISSDQQITVLG